MRDSIGSMKGGKIRIQKERTRSQAGLPAVLYARHMALAPPRVSIPCSIKWDKWSLSHKAFVVVQSLSCVRLFATLDCSTPGFSVLHYLPEFAETHVYWVGGAIQPSHPLSSPSPPAFGLSQHLGLFQWVSSSHQVAKVLELQRQRQSFQWIFRVDFL